MHKPHRDEYPLTPLQKYERALAAYKRAWQHLIDLVGSEEEAQRIYEEYRRDDTPSQEEEQAS